MVLKDKVALVTGASRGIGRGIAEALGQAGADVGINFHSHAEEAEKVAAAVRAAGQRALLCRGDVSEYATVEKMVADTVKAFGRLDIAVSNAVYSDREPFTEADLAGVHRTVDVTMWGAFHLLRATARQMIRQGGGGSIVVISSVLGHVPAGGSMAYNMSKAAVDQMARTAATELVDHRIRVNIVYPGWADTPGERKFASEEALASAAAKLPWGRLQRPEEVARGVVFLCDPASEYVTGASLLMDGGGTLPVIPPWKRE